MRPCLPITFPTSSGSDEEPEDDGVLALLGLDPDGVRLVDEPPHDPLEQLSHRII